MMPIKGHPQDSWAGPQPQQFCIKMTPKSWAPAGLLGKSATPTVLHQNDAEILGIRGTSGPVFHKGSHQNDIEILGTRKTPGQMRHPNGFASQ